MNHWIGTRSSASVFFRRTFRTRWNASLPTSWRASFHSETHWTREPRLCAPAFWSAGKSGAIHRFGVGLSDRFGSTRTRSFHNQSGDCASFVAALQNLPVIPKVHGRAVTARLFQTGVHGMRCSVCDLSYHSNLTTGYSWCVNWPVFKSRAVIRSRLWMSMPNSTAKRGSPG